jgi:phosphoglycolate phosphatase
MPPPRVPALLFDMDGCLVDSVLPITSSINAALARYGLDRYPADELRRCVGPPLIASFQEILDAQMVDTVPATRLVRAYREVYTDIALRETRLVPGVAALLRRLRPTRHRLAVVTSKPVAFAEPILEAVGIADEFEAIVGPSLDPDGETKVATLGRAVSALELSGKDGRVNAVMIGDRAHDVEAGLEFELRTIGVTWGTGSRDELIDAGVHAIVDTPEQLFDEIAGAAVA